MTQMATWQVNILWVVLQERNPELKESESFIMGSKPAFPFLQREALPLYFKAICYINILYIQSIQNKGGECLCLQDVQKHKRPMENRLSPDIRQCMPSVTQWPETLNIIGVSLISEKQARGAVKSGKAAGLWKEGRSWTKRKERTTYAFRCGDRNVTTCLHTHKRPAWLKGKFIQETCGRLELVSGGPGMPKKLCYRKEEGQWRC